MRRLASGCGADWLWLYLEEGRAILLLASLGRVKPHRTEWGLPSEKAFQDPLRSRSETADWQEFSPFHPTVDTFAGLTHLRLSCGGLIHDGLRPLSPEDVDAMEGHLALLTVQREADSLRRRVQTLSSELQDTRRVSERLRPALERGERRAEALSQWYRQASEMLTSTQLRARLPRLAQQAQNLLEADASAILVRESDRVRIWGGESLELEVESAASVDRFGALGRKVLAQGEVYRYQRTGKRRDRFLDGLGLVSALVIPLEIEGRVLGALLFGHRQPHRFTQDEFDLARLTAYQSALFLENSLLVTGSDVERVVARAVLESMADGVLTLDWEKRITSFNPAAEQITGWSAEEAIGRSCEEVMQSRYLCGKKEAAGCQENCPLLTLLADQELMDRGLTVEGTIVHRKGEPRYVSSTYSVVADRGDLLGAVVLFRDITERKRLEEMKSDYAAALSHDLKTPLTAMKGYALTLLRHGERLDRGAQKEALEVINFEIDRVSRMFDNLLHQARLEAGVRNHHYSRVVPLQVVRQVVSLYAYSGRSHRISYRVEPPELSFTTDRDQLDQILNNLVSNALKYTPDGTDIEIVCLGSPNSILFQVRDSGPGIAEADRPYIFRRFHRLGGANSKRVRGTGLGLHITRMLVESLGGEAGVESELGEGSTFWFRLPLEPPPIDEEERPPSGAWYQEFLRRM